MSKFKKGDYILYPTFKMVCKVTSTSKNTYMLEFIDDSKSPFSKSFIDDCFIKTNNHKLARILYEKQKNK